MSVLLKSGESETAEVSEVAAWRDDQGHFAFFLPATVRFGPLRVRALVLVR